MSKLEAEHIPGKILFCMDPLDLSKGVVYLVQGTGNVGLAAGDTLVEASIGTLVESIADPLKRTVSLEAPVESNEGDDTEEEDSACNEECAENGGCDDCY